MQRGTGVRAAGAPAAACSRWAPIAAQRRLDSACAQAAGHCSHGAGCRLTIAALGQNLEVAVERLLALLPLLLLALRRRLHDLHVVVIAAGRLPVRPVGRTALPPLLAGALWPLLLLIRAAQVYHVAHGAGGLTAPCPASLSALGPSQ